MPDQLYGLDAELAKKNAEKYDPEREVQAREFLEQVLELPDVEVKGGRSLSFQAWLKDGSILARVVVKLGIQANLKVYKGAMAFKQMENISAFLQACDSIGVRKSEQFQTVDLFEAKNMMAVVDCIWAFSRMGHARKLFTSPNLLLGPKLATSRELHFSDEQLNASKAAIPMQAGYTGGANQSNMGVTFGAVRDVVTKAPE